jgi:D-glycero-D-manno-heptose 1,7-bisphosphate phosphatase
VSGWATAFGGGPLSLVAPGRDGSATDARAAVFLDRDGVINELVVDPLTGRGESPLSVEQVRLVPGAAVAATRLARSGYVLVCVSNQPAAAKGTVSVAQLLAVHERVLELLVREGVRLEASYLCPHHPAGVVPALSGACRCRKPRPGMLHAAAESLGLDLGGSWMVGDTDADIAAGAAAGCRTLLIGNPDSAHKRLQALNPEVVADSLADGLGGLQLDRLQAVTQTRARYGGSRQGPDDARSNLDTDIRRRRRP